MGFIRRRFLRCVCLEHLFGVKRRTGFLGVLKDVLKRSRVKLAGCVAVEACACCAGLVLEVLSEVRLSRNQETEVPNVAGELASVQSGDVLVLKGLGNVGRKLDGELRAAGDARAALRSRSTAEHTDCSTGSRCCGVDAALCVCCRSGGRRRDNAPTVGVFAFSHVYSSNAWRRASSALVINCWPCGVFW